MLNVFPIQFLAPLAYTVLRLCVGLIFIYLGQSHLRKRHVLKYVFAVPLFPYGLAVAWYVGIAELIIGTMFILGWYTQIAALLGMAYAIKLIILQKRFAHPLISKRQFLALLLGACLSLFITGAGIFAFDLPI
jgi:uncharacterized membrane protein YphA (DoxX/SURF4 family)